MRQVFPAVMVAALFALPLNAQSNLHPIRVADRAEFGKGIQAMTAGRSLPLDVDVSLLNQMAGSEFVLRSVPVAPGVTVDLDLVEQNIFQEGASLLVATEAGEEPLPQPTARLFRGSVVGDPGSDVYFSFSETGVLGHVRSRGKSYEIGTDFEVPTTGSVVAAVAYPSDAVAEKALACGADDPMLREMMGEGYRPEKAVSTPVPLSSSTGTINYNVGVAWEGDAEYVNLFGGVQPATDYAFQLIGQVSAIYERDLETQITVAHLKLWASSSAPGYPYTESQIMSVALNQARMHWRDISNDSIPRVFAHILSGKAWTNPIGIAFLDVACASQRATAFSAITRTNPARDRRVTAHESGHVLGAHHTHHCGWNGPHGGAIHRCAAAEGGSCFGQVQQESGTIMSYCNSSELEFHPLVKDRIIGYLRDNRGGCISQARRLITTPNLVLIPSVQVNTTRDTTFTDFFQNVGFDQIEVTGVTVTGSSIANFTILDGEPPFTLESGETRDFSLRFEATSLDAAKVTFRFTHTGLNPPNEATFEAYTTDATPNLQFVNDQGRIDWSERITGSTNDTTLPQFYGNFGVDDAIPATLYITATDIVGPDAIDFQILDGSAPFQMDGLERRGAVIRYTPTSPGPKSAMLVVESNSGGTPGTLDTFHLGGAARLGPNMQLGIHDLIIDFGDRYALQSYDTVFNDFFSNVGGEPLYYTGVVENLEGAGETFNSDIGFGVELVPGSSDRLRIQLYSEAQGLKRARLILNAVDENFEFDVMNDTIYLVANILPPSGVPESLEPDELFYLSPNVVTTANPVLVLSPQPGEKGMPYLIRVLDVNGREVFRRADRYGESATRVQLATELWTSGTYYVRVASPEGIRTRSLTISR